MAQPSIELALRLGYVGLLGALTAVWDYASGGLMQEYVAATLNLDATPHACFESWLWQWARWYGATNPCPRDPGHQVLQPMQHILQRGWSCDRSWASLDLPCAWALHDGSTANPGGPYALSLARALPAGFALVLQGVIWVLPGLTPRGRHAAWALTGALTCAVVLGLGLGPAALITLAAWLAETTDSELDLCTRASHSA
jgi:hypothetical protein